MDDRATAQPHARDSAMSVVSAQGAFRVLLLLLALWSFFAGFALATQGIGALTLGGGGAAERIAGAQMLILVPVYGLIAWRREEYRLLAWVPYAAQLAVIIPVSWELLRGREFADSALMLIVSIVFLVLLLYVWLSSSTLGVADEPEPAPPPRRALDHGTPVDDGGDDDDVPPSPDRTRRYRRNG